MSGLTATPEETLAQRLDTADRRVMRAEAREALQAENVISDRITDLYLEDIRDKAKIDPATGEAVGIREHVAAWKESHQEFFRKPASQAATTTATQTTKPGELPNLRSLTPKARRAAMEAYKQSMRSTRHIR
jgi:hypothetical protein